MLANQRLHVAIHRRAGSAVAVTEELPIPRQKAYGVATSLLTVSDFEGAWRDRLHQHALLARPLLGSPELLFGLNLYHLASLPWVNARSMLIILRLDEK